MQIRNSRAGATLPPTPNRDGKTISSISSRILPDTDAFTKSLAASSISDKISDSDNTEGKIWRKTYAYLCQFNLNIFIDYFDFRSAIYKN